MRYIASCSFGKDSLAMVLRLIEENRPLDEVIFYDKSVEQEVRWMTIKETIKELETLKEMNETGTFYYFPDKPREIYNSALEYLILCRMVSNKNRNRT